MNAFKRLLAAMNPAPLLLRLFAAIERLHQSLFSRIKPAQALPVGFLIYITAGTLLVSLPFARQQPAAFVDNLFNVTSAISTTGLTTISVSDTYSFFGEFVFVCLFQIGGIGYMTLSSFIILARGRSLSDVRVDVLKAGFSLPQGLDISRFIYQVGLFTLLIESIGTLLLYFEFSAAGVAQPLWSAVFHCVSAFATAGFSLNNNGLEGFADNWVVNLTIGTLCYLGAIGFIVIQDAWLSARSRERKITFTSKVILLMTAFIFLVQTPLLVAFEPTLAAMPVGQRWMAAAFQVMSASSTAGFNTIPIGQLSAASITLIIIAMIIGASPSGTGGGIKTTTISSLMAILFSSMRGQERVTFGRHEIPMVRILTAVANASLYLIVLALGVYLMSLVGSQQFLPMVFETASALGTVGLSMGITGSLIDAEKWLLIALMFIGRVGPLTLGLAFLHQRNNRVVAPKQDLAV